MVIQEAESVQLRSGQQHRQTSPGHASGHTPGHSWVEESLEAQRHFVERIQTCSRDFFERHAKGMEQLVDTLDTVTANPDLKVDAEAWQTYFLGFFERVNEDMRDGFETMFEGMSAAAQGGPMLPWLGNGGHQPANKTAKK